MYNFYRMVVSLVIISVSQSFCDSIQYFMPSYKRTPQNCHKLLKNIQKEHPFNSLLILQQNYSDAGKYMELLQFPMPKVVIATGYEFAVHKKFNSEVLAIIVMSRELDYQLFQTAAVNLNFIRQTRIIVVMFDVENLEAFKVKLLELCEQYKMTNVLLQISYTFEDIVDAPQLLQLKPYPLYHWLESFNLTIDYKYFPIHWLNMQNKTLITYTDQVAPRTLLFQDIKGNLQLNGYLARMVLLFAEHFNASLKMYRPVKVGDVVHYSVLLNLTKEGKLDLPIVAETGYELANSSTVYELGKGMLMVPCASRKTTQEIFGLLMDVNFITCVLVCSLVLTMAHSCIDYYFLNVNISLNCIIHDHVLPGVLGQPFSVRLSQMSVLRIVYFLVGFAGINIAALFAGHLNTLLTIPPHHRQIASFGDLRKSELKILLEAQLADSGTWGLFLMGKLKAIKDSITFTSNISEVIESRQNFNTSYGYYAPSSLWQIYMQRQHFFTEKIFCTAKSLVVFDQMPWGLRLQFNSPYKEAMNYLIHRVHESGLMEAWRSSTFADMLQLKLVSIRDPNPGEIWKILDMYDLLWVWMIVVVGLASSLMVFVAELLLGKVRSVMTSM